MLDQTQSLPDDPSELRSVAVQLAATVKSHLGQSTGLGVERMTSLEIAQAIEDPCY